MKTSKGTESCSNRRLFAIDIENYCGKPKLSEADIVMARSEICDGYKVSDLDLVVIGTSASQNCLNAGLGWENARLVMKKGCDGADHALIEALSEYPLYRFDEVLLISGDGMFLECVKAMITDGIKVTVVSQRKRMSQKLKMATPSVQYISRKKNVGGKCLQQRET